MATATETDGPAGTERLAAGLAGELAGGDVVLVEGELGAGKTTFVRGAARALGVTEAVTSPTFTIGQLYRPARDGPAVAHLDLYRLGSLSEEEPELLAPYFGPDRVTFVEWPEAAGGEPELENVAARVRIEHAGGDRRRIAVGR